jgi:hypothetical protein
MLLPKTEKQKRDMAETRQGTRQGQGRGGGPERDGNKKGHEKDKTETRKNRSKDDKGASQGKTYKTENGRQDKARQGKAR